MQSLRALILSLAVLVLAAAPAAAFQKDPLHGAWLPEEEGAPALVLHAGGEGQLGDQALRWRRFGKRRLRIERDGTKERPGIDLEADALTVQWAGGTASYRRAPKSFPVVPPALAGAAGSRGKAWTHPRDYFSCRLPARWTVEELGDEWMVLNPGLSRGDTVEALAFVGWGELEDEDVGRTPTDLIRANERAWLQELRKDGMRLKAAKEAPRRILVGDIPGAQQEWSGTLSGKPIRMWLGGLVKGDAFLYVAVVVLEERADAYVPRAKDLFLSVVPTPPERNPMLERALVGKTLVSTKVYGDSHDRPDGTGWSYTFREDGRLESFWYLTGGHAITSIASFSSTEWGFYEVYGDEVYVYLKSGQVSGRVLQEGGAPVAVEVDGVRYGL